MKLADKIRAFEAEKQRKDALEADIPRRKFIVERAFESLCSIIEDKLKKHENENFTVLKRYRPYSKGDIKIIAPYILVEIYGKKVSVSPSTEDGADTEISALITAEGAGAKKMHILYYAQSTGSYWAIDTRNIGSSDPGIHPLHSGDHLEDAIAYLLP